MRAVRIRSANLPTAQQGAVGCANGEIFTAPPNMDKRGIGLANQIGGQRAAKRMKKSRSGEPAGDSGEQGREEQEDENDAKKSTHSRGNENGREKVPGARGPDS